MLYLALKSPGRSGRFANAEGQSGESNAYIPVILYEKRYPKMREVVNNGYISASVELNSSNDPNEGFAYAVVLAKGPSQSDTGELPISASIMFVMLSSG